MAHEATNLKIKEEDRTASLELQNLRIEDAIKLLEGRPATNQLAMALREAQIKADDLALATGFRYCCPANAISDGHHRGGMPRCPVGLLNQSRGRIP